MNLTRPIGLVRIFSAENPVWHVSLAGIINLDYKGEHFIVRPCFVDKPLTFIYNATHQRFEHSTPEGEVFYIPCSELERL